MRYTRAEEILPPEILELVQTYAEGQMLYIPKKHPLRQDWGAVSGTKAYYAQRNAAICAEARSGCTVAVLAEKYALTVKSIQRILREDDPSCRSNSTDRRKKP